MSKTAIPIFLSSSNKYADYMSALIVSIMDNTDASIDFYVVDGGISSYKKKRLKELQEKWQFNLEFVDIEPFKHLFRLPVKPSGYVTIDSSNRFFIPYIKPELDRGIILDVDMIALGDIKKLWEVDLGNKLLAAVPQVEMSWEPTQFFIPKDHAYFNMGVMIVNFKKWRDENILSKLSEIEIRFDANKVYGLDEIMLNLLLASNKYRILPPNFNVDVFSKTFCSLEQGNIKYKCPISLPEGEMADNIFIHFVTFKPWDNFYYSFGPNSVIQIPHFEEFWHYLSKTPFFYENQLVFLNKNAEVRIAEIKKQYATLFNFKLKQEYKQKYKFYQHLKIATLGLVPPFRRKVKEYREKYKSL